MAWTEPQTWTGEVLTSNDLNTYVRDNQLALKSPPSVNYESDEGADYTTTSTVFADVDSTDFTFNIDISGDTIFIGFSGSVVGSGAGISVFLDVTVDGTPVGGDDGIIVVRTAASNPANASFFRLVTGLTTGSHTVVLRWKVSTGTGTMYAGAGTSGGDTHPQFFVREMS